MTTDQSTYQWGVRDRDGLDQWEDELHPDPIPPPYTEARARYTVRLGFWVGYKLLRRSPTGEVEVVAYEPTPMEPPTDQDLAPDVTEGLPVGVLGEDSDWAVVLGHVEPIVMAEAATARLRDLHSPTEIDPLSPATVAQVHAVRVDSDWTGDDEGGWAVVWKWPDGTEVTAETPGAFALTILDLPW